MKEFKTPLRIDFAGGWIDLPDFCKHFDGHVVNVAIRPYVHLKENTINFTPYIPGGGISSSTGALILEQLSLMTTYSNDGKIYTTPGDLAETIFKIENQMIGYKIGRQDQYAIGTGGLNVLRFGKNNGQEKDFEIELHISEMDHKLKDFQDSLILVHSGIQRPAQNLAKIVRRNVALEKPEHMTALRDIGICGTMAAKAILEKEYYRLAKIMSLNWDAQKRFAPESTNNEIDDVYNAMLKNGALGGKLCGAGGGGYFVFYCNNKEQIKIEAKKRGLQIIEPEFEMKNILELNLLKPNAEKTKILNPDEIEQTILKLKKDGKKIGFCSGCFDILVSGHALFFAECKELCDILFVSVGKDIVIKRLKGESRPINSEKDRIFLVSSLSYVDYAILGGEDMLPGKIDHYDNLKKIKPNIYILNDDDSAIEEKSKLCKNMGIELKLIKRSALNPLNPTSSTKVIEKLYEK